MIPDEAVEAAATTRSITRYHFDAAVRKWTFRGAVDRLDGRYYLWVNGHTGDRWAVRVNDYRKATK